MIPLSLKIRDLLSYADPDPIDFTGFDVACLSGDNGAGKSAILDAITWALFGAARGCEGGQNQDRLIRDGCEDAAVEFEFELGGARHRVMRRRSRAGKGELRFELADGGAWTNVAGESLRETEARISQTLRMDYRTFTASAFFVQGRAEDFLSRMRPEDRKEVFARLLDLGAYEQLEDAARERTRDSGRMRDQLARRLESLGGVTEELEELERALSEAERSAAEAAKAVAAVVADVDAKRRSVAGLERLDAKLEVERKALAQAQEEVDRLRGSIDTRTTEAAEIDSLLARTEEVQDALKESERLAEEEAQARVAQERAFELDKRRATVLERISNERKIIESRVVERTSTIEAFAKELTDLGKHQKELELVERSLEGSRDPSPAIDETRQSGERQRTAEARLCEQLRTIEAARAELRERVEVLGRGEGECPVCGTALDEEHRKRVDRDLSKTGAELERRFERAHAERETAHKEAERCAEELKRLEKARAERERLLAARDTLRARVERVPGMRDELERLRSDAAADAHALAKQTFATELRSQADALSEQIGAAYDARSHKALRKRLVELERYTLLAGRIDQATTRRTAVDRELADLGSQLAAREAAMAERRGTVDELTASIAGLVGAREELTTSEHVLEERRATAARHGSEIVRMKEKLVGARKAVEERDSAAAAERDTAAEHRRYGRLAEAFGRGGIPDLVIDNARPQLESDANAILGRLTDYEMSVHFEMQRETRSGKTRETFDVLVHHEGGLRDFAMFSGGEAFRIAFAVRLALSQLLVRRAGARLETLVIDEGFGTQDPAGRERLIEAIDHARQEFRKVLVITHLDDLKDLFGAQIQVCKHPEKGSEVRVLTS